MTQDKNKEAIEAIQPEGTPMGEHKSAKKNPACVLDMAQNAIAPHASLVNDCSSGLITGDGTDAMEAAGVK